MKYWTRLATVSLMILGMAVPVAAQDQASEAVEIEESAPHLPADSIELGAGYMDMILNYDAEDLREHFTDELKESFGSADEIMDRMMGLFDQIGSQEEVVSQRYWMRHGKPQFWHTAIFSSVDEPFVFRLVIEPDGEISGMGINPESQNPEVDDPDQHSDADGIADEDADA